MSFLSNFKKIVVIGDIILDEYIYGNVGKISQEAPVVVFKKNSSNFKLGGAANVAVNLRALNAKTILIGLFGRNNAVNKRAFSLIRKNKISLLKINDQSYETPVKTRFNSNNQQLFRVDSEITNKNDYSNFIIKQLKSIINQFEIVILSDYDKGFLNKTNKIINYLKKNKKIILADPKSNNFNKSKGVHLVKPNKKEIEKIIDVPYTSSEKIDKLVQKEIIKNKLKYILLTLGDQGMILYEKNNSFRISNKLNPKVYDVTGAGDTVIATLAFYLNNNFSINDAAIVSNLAGNIVVSKNETATITVEELNKQENLYSEKKNKIVSINELSNLLKNQFKDKKIIFTNGCFDILHSGHIHLLKKAKALGDILIVGVNSDQSVSKLKGQKRPINKINERLILLESLEFTDILIEFKEETPIKIIKKIRPDLIVKGSDYNKNNVVGYEFVKSYGGDVKIINKLGNFSTSSKLKLINKI